MGSKYFCGCVAATIFVILNLPPVSHTENNNTNSEKTQEGCTLEKIDQEFNKSWCRPVQVSTYRCIGFCESVLMPDLSINVNDGLPHSKRPFTSYATCCSMKKSSQVTKSINFTCLEGIEMTNYNEPTECECSWCRKYR